MPKTKYRTGQCVGCGGLAPLLCDYELGSGKTCDAPLCRSCAESKPQFPGMTGIVCTRGRGGYSYRLQDMTLDYCPAHREEEAIFG